MVQNFLYRGSSKLYFNCILSICVHIVLTLSLAELYFVIHFNIEVINNTNNEHITIVLIILIPSYVQLGMLFAVIITTIIVRSFEILDNKHKNFMILKLHSNASSYSITTDCSKNYSRFPVSCCTNMDIIMINVLVLTIVIYVSTSLFQNCDVSKCHNRSSLVKTGSQALNQVIS